MGVLSEKTEALHAELNKRAEAATSNCFAVDFLQYIYLMLVAKNHIRSDQGVFQFMNFPSQIFFKDINHGYRAAILKKSPLWLVPS